MKAKVTRAVLGLLVVGIAAVGTAGSASATPFTSHATPFTSHTNPFTSS
jgi:hypothetical protein